MSSDFHTCTMAKIQTHTMLFLKNKINKNNKALGNFEAVIRNGGNIWNIQEVSIFVMGGTEMGVAALVT